MMGCPKCYSAKYTTVALKDKGNGELVCTSDSSHVFVLDEQGFPKRKK